MTIPQMLNIFGLVGGIAGAVLLFLFGLPPQVSRGGVSSLLLEQVDEAEKSRAARYDRLGHVGIGLVLLAFLLQLAAALNIGG